MRTGEPWPHLEEEGTGRRLQGHSCGHRAWGGWGGCWVGTLERSGRCWWSRAYTIAPDEGRHLGFISEKPDNQKASALGAGGRPVQASVPEPAWPLPAGAEIPETRHGVWRRWGRRKRAGGVPLLTRRPAALAWPPVCCVLSPQPAGRGLTSLQTPEAQVWNGWSEITPPVHGTPRTQTWVCQTLQPGGTGRQPREWSVEDQTEASRGGNGGGQAGEGVPGLGRGWLGFQPLLLRQLEEACGLAHGS